MLQGGCFCGAIRYETRGATHHESICHCTMCRRAAGAPLVAWFSVPRPELRILTGTPRWFRSSEHAERGFCPTCGTQLFFRSDRHPEEIDLTTASLDDPALVPPRDQIYAATRIAWLSGLDQIPSYPDART